MIQLSIFVIFIVRPSPAFLVISIVKKISFVSLTFVAITSLYEFLSRKHSPFSVIVIVCADTRQLEPVPWFRQIGANVPWEAIEIHHYFSQSIYTMNLLCLHVSDYFDACEKRCKENKRIQLIFVSKTSVKIRIIDRPIPRSAYLPSSLTGIIS